MKSRASESSLGFNWLQFSDDGGQAIGGFNRKEGLTSETGEVGGPPYREAASSCLSQEPLTLWALKQGTPHGPQEATGEKELWGWARTLDLTAELVS